MRQARVQGVGQPQPRPGSNDRAMHRVKAVGEVHMNLKRKNYKLKHSGQTRRGVLASVSLVISMLVAAPVWASYSCTGTVNDVNVSPGTGVVIFTSSAGLNSVYLCLLEGSSTNSSNGTVTPGQCKAMLSILLTAQTSGQSVTLSFNDSLTCTTHNSWDWLTGWYWGPSLHSN